MDTDGVWISYSWDYNPIDVRPHQDELKARQFSDINTPGYGHVIFVRWGEDIQEAEDRERKE